MTINFFMVINYYVETFFMVKMCLRLESTLIEHPEGENQVQVKGHLSSATCT